MYHFRNGLAIMPKFLMKTLAILMRPTLLRPPQILLATLLLHHTLMIYQHLRILQMIK